MGKLAGKKRLVSGCFLQREEEEEEEEGRTTQQFTMSATSLKTFLFPTPEARFFRAGGLLYKFNIRGGSSFSGEDVTGGRCFNQELEEIIRTVLGNLDSLQPFFSAHFIVFPYKRRWKGGSQMCQHSEGDLRAYPFTLVLYLEKNMQNGKQAEQEPNPVSRSSSTMQTQSSGSTQEAGGAQFCPPASEPPSMCHRSDSPLEEAVLKEVMADLEAESPASGVGVHTDNPHAEGDVKEDPGHVDKRETILSNEAEAVSSINKFRGSPGDVPAGTTEDMQEEESDIEEDNSVPGSPADPGILTRMARRVFPFSLLLRDA